MIPSNFLKASDLLIDDNYGEVDVTVAKVAQQEMPNDGGEKWVVHFEEFDKGLVLNVTNTRKLGELCGDQSDDWIGKRVQLHVVPVAFRGEEIDAIRVKQAGQSRVKPGSKAPGGVTAPDTDEIPF
jgi:hypothetical protein